MSQKTKDILLGTVATLALLAGAIYLFTLHATYGDAVDINTSLYGIVFPILIGTSVYRLATDSMPEKTTPTLWQKIGTWVLYALIAGFLLWLTWYDPYDLSLWQLYGMLAVGAVLEIRKRCKTQKSNASQLRTIAWLTIALYAYAVLTTVGYLQYFNPVTEEQAAQTVAQAFGADTYPYGWLENDRQARQDSPLGYYIFFASDNDLPAVRVAVMDGRVLEGA